MSLADRPTLRLPTPLESPLPKAVPPLIVVVEPSLTIRTVMQISLQANGYEVRAFGDGIAFLQWLLTPEARLPNLIFLELALPKMDGYTLMQHLKAKPAFAHTILCILLHNDSISVRIKGQLAGAHRYLIKPFRIQELLALTQDALGH